MPFPELPAPLAAALSARGYAEPTPVQAAVTEPSADRRDLLVSAQTGSGKTVAYGLALHGELLDEAGALPPAGEPLALVVAPTRELALQVQRELEWLYADVGAQIAPCVGGMDPRSERRRLERGAHIVVGTPGRLRDHLERGALVIGNLRALVLDEADEMLNLGFREDLEFILEATPAQRRTLLFSATLPKAIATMAKRYQRDALRIEATRSSETHADIAYKAVRIAPTETEHAVVNLLRFHEAPSAIVFCNTRESVRHLHSGLVERGFSAVSLSGELGQAERNQAMQALRDGRARVCVATDVAARGLDLPSLGLVIHAELPNDWETLKHRSGRTGRAGRKGISVLLIPISRRKKAERLMAEASIKPEWGGAPTADDIRRLDEERMLADPMLSEDLAEEDLAAGRRLLEGRSPEALAGLLARTWRLRLPAPEDVYDPGFSREAKPDRGERTRERGGKDPREAGDFVWFRLDIGRRNSADPKWLLPLLCRRGKTTKQEIGAIKIFDRETKFEVVASGAAKFAKAALGTLDDIEISYADGAPAEAEGRSADRPKGGKPPFAKPRGPKPDFKPRESERPARAEGERPFRPREGDRPQGEAKPRGPFQKKTFAKSEGGYKRDGGAPKRRPKD